jgi:hypothetical protein
MYSLQMFLGTRQVLAPMPQMRQVGQPNVFTPSNGDVQNYVAFPELSCMEFCDTLQNDTISLPADFCDG